MIYREAQAPWFGFLMLSFFLFLTGLPSAEAAAGPPTKLVLTVGAVSEREGALYVALDQGFFRKHGIDLTLVQVRSGPIGIAALTSGESQLNWGSVSAANLGAIAEGADLVFVAGFINKLTGNLVSNPRISSPPQLKGKSIGINSLGGGAWIFTMLTLDYWGLAPERDKIQFRPLGDQSVIAQGVLGGTVDAAFLGYTYGKILESKGFRILADVEKLPIPYQGSGLLARRSFVAYVARDHRKRAPRAARQSRVYSKPREQVPGDEKLGERIAPQAGRGSRGRISDHARFIREKDLPERRRHSQRHPAAGPEQRKNPPPKSRGIGR